METHVCRKVSVTGAQAHGSHTYPTANVSAVQNRSISGQLCESPTTATASAAPASSAMLPNPMTMRNPTGSDGGLPDQKTYIRSRTRKRPVEAVVVGRWLLFERTSYRGSSAAWHAGRWLRISAQCGSPPPRNPVGHLQILCQIRSDLGEERPLSKHCGTGSFLAIRRVGFWIRSCLLVGSSMINSCTRACSSRRSTGNGFCIMVFFFVVARELFDTRLRIQTSLRLWRIFPTCH